jgi:hypothetical protein
MPAAAILFRQGHVRTAEQVYRIELSRAQVFDKLNSVNAATAIRTLVERSQVALALPEVEEFEWDAPAAASAGATVITDLNQDFVAPGATHIEADTGELRRDWGLGIQTIDTPRTQAASGWIGGEDIALGDVSLSIATPKASVAVTSLDGEPIKSSRRILITCVAQAVAPDGDLPFFAEPVAGTVRIGSDHSGANLRAALGSERPEAPPTPIAAKQGRFEFAIPTDVPTHWFVLEVESP